MSVQNAATRIGAAIESMQAQTFTDWELLVIDAGSTDPTRAVVARYMNGDHRIRVVPAAGHLAHAWRQGLTLARGGYIYSLDANHRSLPDTLQRLYEQLETQLEAVVAYGAVAGMPSQATPLDVLAQLAAGHFLSTGAVAMRRAALEEAPALPETDGADQMLWWFLAAQGAVAFVEGSPLSAACASPPARLRASTCDGRSTHAHTPVKLAYLIVAHHQPTHLARLIRALDQDNSAFFIHIDAKVPLAPFTAVVPQRDNLIFLPHRVEVHWGRISVVQAVLQLIHAAVASGQAFTYYILLSGSDYPIKDTQAIGAHFRDSQRQYIRIDRPLTSAAENPHAYRLQNLPQGKYFGHLTPYQGSMYWSLTADCIRFILDFVHDNPGYLDIHQHIFAPDEAFFHTLVKHSPFAAAVTHDFSNGSYPNHTHHGNHFIDWGRLRKRNYLTLDERDFGDLLASEALFARKFDAHTSRTLLDLLDTHVH